MWNIVICDSDAAFADQLKQKAEQFYDKKKFEYKITVYTDGQTFTEHVDSPMNLVFVNTQLSDMRGYVIAELLRVCKEDVKIIFVSDNDADVFESFRYLPFWYVRKAEWEKEVDEALARLWALEFDGRCIHLPQRRGHQLIPLNEILYMESRGHYVRVHCGDRIYQTRRKLGEYVELLRDQYFIQPSKSFLVNCAYIEAFDNGIRLKNGEHMNCSKSRRNEARRMYEKYVMEITYF